VSAWTGKLECSRDVLSQRRQARKKKPGNSIISCAIARTQSDTQCQIKSNSDQDELPVKAGTGYISKSLQILNLAEAQRTQRFLLVVGATLVANIGNSRLKSLLRIPVKHSACSAPLRENRMLNFRYWLVYGSGETYSSCQIGSRLVHIKRSHFLSLAEHSFRYGNSSPYRHKPRKNAVITGPVTDMHQSGGTALK
jgi:hypothetical protein